MFLNVGQAGARHGVHFHYFCAGSALAYVLHQFALIHRRFLVNERQGDKFGETAGLLLNVAQQVHMFYPVGWRFDVAVHNR